MKNKVAVVTGGSRGIGFATAKALSREGCRVAICGKSEKNLKKAEKGLGKNIFAARCDMRKKEDIEKFVLDIRKKFGNVDILVNNAGVAYYKNLDKMSVQEINDTIDVNIRGLIYMTKSVMPLMNRGLIINISSGAGKTGYPGLAAYCASKFAVLGFTEAMAGENKNIKFIAVCPGSVDTDMYRSFSIGKASLKPEHIASKVMEICTEPHKFESGSAAEVYHVSDVLNHLKLKYFGKK